MGNGQDFGAQTEAEIEARAQESAPREENRAGGDVTVRQLIKLLADLPRDADVYTERDGVQVPLTDVCMAKFVTKIPTNESDVALIT